MWRVTRITRLAACATPRDGGFSFTYLLPWIDFPRQRYRLDRHTRVGFTISYGYLSLSLSPTLFLSLHFRIIFFFFSFFFTSDIPTHLYIIFIVHIGDLLDRMGRRSQGSCVQYFVASRGTWIFSRTMKLCGG